VEYCIQTEPAADVAVLAGNAKESQACERGIRVNRKRILLADDHTEMLREVWTLLEKDYEIIGAVENGKSLVDAAQSLRPDLIVSDISMPEMTGFEAAAKIRSLGIPTKLIFLTVQSSNAYVKKAKALGADGYVLKVYSNEQLPTAVARVLNGERYVSPQLQTGQAG
jgi:DNA-binding NarL/FixJ family response regulator